MLHPAAITLGGFMLAFGAVYLAGYFDLTDKAALAYWLKGLGTWTVHFLYLILGAAHLVRRGRALFLRAVYVFTAGLVVNCVYGVIQLGLAIAAGINLDKLVVGPLTANQGGIGGINVYGTVAGSQNVYRINALTGDPNHLGVMLCVPLMVLLPYYLGDRRGRRRTENGRGCDRGHQSQHVGQRRARDVGDGHRADRHRCTARRALVARPAELEARRGGRSAVWGRRACPHRVPAARALARRRRRVFVAGAVGRAAEAGIGDRRRRARGDRAVGGLQSRALP